MKLTRAALAKIIAAETQKAASILLEMPIASSTGTKMHQQDNYPNGKDPDGYEGDMAKRSLYHMTAQAQQLHDIIADDENLEPWVQDKISKAADYLESAFKAIIYDKENPKGR